MSGDSAALLAIITVCACLTNAISQCCQTGAGFRHPPCGDLKLWLDPGYNVRAVAALLTAVELPPMGDRHLFVFPSPSYAPSTSTTPTPAYGQGTDAMKVTIREWNAVAAWRWDMPDDDVCGICRNPYDSTCSKCKFPGDECPLCKFDELVV